MFNFINGIIIGIFIGVLSIAIYLDHHKDYFKNK